MEQFEQLLTCAICLDRYRNPKLLPCQHSFCMEPCMDGLMDYVRRQVKCPECRAEHRIPYQGVQGYPTNVTLQRFLELHIEITGELPDPTSGQIMERCNVCSEKSYCMLCHHCEKKICADCKGAHMDILRREIARINNQVRRALHRLEDMLAMVDKNLVLLQQNCCSVSEEVDEIDRRIAKALKDRTEFLRNEIERYLSTEVRNLSHLKENLELEISNISSNCDLADKHMTEAVEWDDCELMDAKEIFLKTVEFIRNFETETGDYQRRVRLTLPHDPNQVVSHVGGYADLNIAQHHGTSFGGSGAGDRLGMSGGVGTAGSGSGGSAGGNNLLQALGPGLMRSKSDHRLASQFRQQDDRYDDDRAGRLSPLGGRKFGERRSAASIASNTDRYGEGRYGRGDARGEGGRGGGAADYDYSEYEPDSGRSTARSKYRSRFRHGHADPADSDPDTGRSVRFQEQQQQQQKQRERVLDTEDVSRGPLSGITRLYDSPRVMKRLHESELKERNKDKQPPAAAAVPPAQPAQTQQLAAQQKTQAQRQVSEEDEIAKIKRQNKAGGSSTETTTPNPATESRPVAERVAALKRTGTSTTGTGTGSGSSDDDQRRSTAEATSDAESDEGTPLPTVPQRRTSTPTAIGARTGSATPGSRRSSGASESTTTAPGAGHKKATRSASTDSSTSSESSATSHSAARNTGAAFTTQELKQKYLSRGADKTPSTPTSETPVRSRAGTQATTAAASHQDSTPPRFQSRFLGSGSRASSQVDKTTKEEEEEETETSSEEETDSDEEEDKNKTKTATTQREVDRTDIGPLLARSANARDSSASARRDSRDESGYRSRYGQLDSYRSPLNREDSAGGGYRGRGSRDETEPATRYSSSSIGTAAASSGSVGGSSSGSTPYTSRFLNKSKSSAAVEDDDSSSRRYPAATPDDSTRYPSGRSRYAALKDRRSRLARSRSSHNMGGADGEDDNEPEDAASAYLAARGYGPATSDLSRSRSTHALKSRDNSPERTSGTAEKDGAALSSWARYLKNKYGNRKEGSGGGTGAGTSASSTSTARRLSLGLPLRHTNSTSMDSSDEDQKNPAGSPTSPIAVATAVAGFGAGASSPRSQYLQKRRQLFQIGSRGSEPGSFTWPRGIAVGPDNTIVVADSSNHRVQVFDANGSFVKEFGGYGNGEGEFDCLAGVAVNRIGQFIIADRYNHRIQVMDPAGRFLRAFGSQGTSDGRFNYPWGITTDALGFIYVCDKENHRVQVFQSDGTFVGKFGSCGSKVGQLEHPHYIAVSSTNRVIVSDSNNHRVQIFDVNGRVLTSFGSEGSEEGQFKFPRGVAVDDQGYIFVGDSGNNRIQIFHPDGTFLRAFGTWGAGAAEFKGLEGVAVTSNGNILVCDRENHRIQVF